MILLIITSMFSYFVLFNTEKQKVDNNIEIAEQNLNYTYKILIPDEVNNRDQSIIYDSMVKVLRDHKANIFYNRMIGDNKVIKYIYLSNMKFSSNYVITKGRMLNIEENDSNNFLSSQDTSQGKQIGKIGTFDGKLIIEIHTLKSMVQSDFNLGGYCTVQLSKNDNINKFNQDLEKSLDTNNIQVTPKDKYILTYDSNKWLIPALYISIIFLILYHIIKSYKKYGIKKMLGYSSVKIWLEESSIILIMQVIIMILVFIGMSIYLFKEKNVYFLKFLKIVLAHDIEQLIALFVVSSIPFIYLINIRIENVVKNKLPIFEVIVFNSITKIFLIILCFNLINVGINNYQRIRNIFNDNYKRWQNTENYYVIPAGNSKSSDVEQDKFEQIQVSLYNNLNKDGAILADFYLYSPTQRKIMLSESKYSYERDNITINPNYLKSNVIYDSNNKPISVSENETNIILLVPEKYKNSESSIINMIETREKAYKNSTNLNRKVKIIYTKSNQKYFSYELDVNPNAGNMVMDPIAKVTTEKNGTADDYGVIIGNGGNPVKIKVNPSMKPEEFIKNKLKEVNLDKYVDRISSASEGVASEISSVHKLLTYVICGLIILIISIAIIIVQNIYCFFEQYRKHIAIMQVHGYKTFDKYYIYWMMLILDWVIISIVQCYLFENNIEIQLVLILIFISLELLITTIAIKLVGKRKIASTIKGSL